MNDHSNMIMFQLVQIYYIYIYINDDTRYFSNFIELGKTKTYVNETFVISTNMIKLFCIKYYYYLLLTVSDDDIFIFIVVDHFIPQTTFVFYSYVEIGHSKERTKLYLFVREKRN